MNTSSMEIVYIYALSEIGKDEVRYIGQTNDPTGRLKSHIRDMSRSLSDDNPKRLWIENVIIDGGEIKMDIIEQCNIESAHIREKHWLEFYSNQGHRLTNSAVPCRTKIFQCLNDITSGVLFRPTAYDMGVLLAIAESEPYLCNVDDLIRFALHTWASKSDRMNQLEKRVAAIENERAIIT